MWDGEIENKDSAPTIDDSAKNLLHVQRAFRPTTVRFSPESLDALDFKKRWGAAARASWAQVPPPSEIPVSA